MRIRSKPTIVLFTLLTVVATQSMGHAQGGPGTPSTLLFYNFYSGAGATGRITADGQFDETGQTSFSTEWSHIVNTPNGVLFYANWSGLVAVARANPAGGPMTTLSVQNIGASDTHHNAFTHVVGTDTGVLFYGGQSAWIGHVTADGQLVFTQKSTGWGPDTWSSWDHIVSFPGGWLVFAHQAVGAVAAGYIRQDGVFVQTDGRDLRPPGRVDKVVPMTDARGHRSILFYGVDGTHSIAVLDGAGRLSMRPASCAPVLDLGYRLIVQSGSSIFFYREDGAAAIASLAGNEVINPACRGQLRLQSVHGPGYLNEDYTWIVPIGDRLVLYKGQDGAGLVAAITPSGSLAVTAAYDPGSFMIGAWPVVAIGR
jgi:hypothetical protein